MTKTHFERIRWLVGTINCRLGQLPVYHLPGNTSAQTNDVCLFQESLLMKFCGDYFIANEIQVAWQYEMWSFADGARTGVEQNFVKLGEDVISLLGTPYDYGSVMHYDAYDFAIDSTVPTIIPLDENAVIGQRVTLSQLDIERVQIHYGCLNPASTSMSWKKVDDYSEDLRNYCNGFVE